MSEPASISMGIAARYATAIFDLAKEGNAISTLEASIDDLAAALDDSDDLRGMISSPLLSREEQGQAITAVATRMNLEPTFVKLLGLMAENRRLFVLPQLIARLRLLIAEEKGEVAADVISAKALTKAQADKLAASLKSTVGKTVKINATVDESLIGGLVVKVGSKMIDTSIRSKLGSLQNVMKEVG